MGEAAFVCECLTTLRNLSGSSDLSQPHKELVMGSASDSLREWHGWTVEEVCSHWLLEQFRVLVLALPLLGLNLRAGLADMPDCPRCGSDTEETAEHAFNYCERVRPFWDYVGEWTARIEPKQLVLLDVGYVIDNVLPPFQGEKRVVFLTILAVTGM